MSIIVGANSLFSPVDKIFTQITDNSEVKEHKHECIEFSYVISGTSIDHINGLDKELSTGSYRLLTPLDTHYIDKISSNYLNRDILIEKSLFISMCNTYSPNLYKEIENNLLNLRGTLSIAETESFEQIIELYKNCVNSTSKRVQIAKFIISKILLLLISSSSKPIERWPVWINQLVNKLSAPQTFDKKLSQHTQTMNMSKEYMSRIFKKYIGMSIVDYYNLQKIKYANILISTNSYSIVKVCDIVNIKNISYFYKLYKKTYGITPKRNSKAMSDF